MERTIRAGFLRILSLDKGVVRGQDKAEDEDSANPAEVQGGDDTPNESLSLFESTFEALMEQRDTGGSLFSTGSRELIVLAGEAAVHVSNFRAASRALEA